jgi:hypothetical protein
LFYHKAYPVWGGAVQNHRLSLHADATFALLTQRPGLFARSLFSNMLWFGPSDALTAFASVAHQVPTRLLLSLSMYADFYFDKTQTRTAQPLGGSTRSIPMHALLQNHTEEELLAMAKGVKTMCLNDMKRRFTLETPKHDSIYIDPQLFNIPLPIGDRSQTIHDAGSAMQGTTFPVLGNKIRLFMQWGVGLTGHLDMDLSASILYEDKKEVCSYFQLQSLGALHSGDVQSIVGKNGAAEYIELDVKSLKAAEAQYVVFSCNAFTSGGITPDLVVGWMDAIHPMHISSKTGVAFDPSCVQHQVSVTEFLSRALTFGVLDVQKGEIIWLEMSFNGRTVLDLDTKSVKAYLTKLAAKMSIGELLEVMAEAQNLTVTNTPETAEMQYDVDWAKNNTVIV